MTKAEAEALRARLEREHPERATSRRVAREGDHGWEVVRLPLPPGTTRGPLRPTIEAKPRPPQADDPRSAGQRDAPGTLG